MGTSIGEYSGHVVTEGTEPREGGRIVRAWIIVDSKIYSGIPMPQGWRLVPEGKVVATGVLF